MSIHHPRTWEGRAFLATSLDGYVARRNHDLAWLTDPPPSAGHVEPHLRDAVHRFAHPHRTDQQRGGPLAASDQRLR